MLNFIYYPVSAILWFWHKVFGFVPFLGPDSGITWALSVVFLTFTVRLLLYKPFVGQVRSMRKMQEFAPEIQKLKKKYGNDRQKMAAEMQKLQSQHGVNPLGGCLPIFVQIPVFIGLFHVLRSFNRPFLTEQQNRETPNYVFGSADVQSFLDARLFGVPLPVRLIEPAETLSRFGEIGRVHIGLVVVPLTILAGVLTHLTARHSVARQTEAQAANPQAAIMNKVMLYLFPVGIVAGGPFFPLPILLYWLSNNLWTLAQQRVVYKKIDAEEAAKKEAAIAEKESMGPRPGQKPRAGQKPVRKRPANETDANPTSSGAEGGEATEDAKAPKAPKATGGTQAKKKPQPGTGSQRRKPSQSQGGQAGRTTRSSSNGARRGGGADGSGGDGAGETRGSESGTKSNKNSNRKR